MKDHQVIHQFLNISKRKQVIPVLYRNASFPVQVSVPVSSCPGISIQVMSSAQYHIRVSRKAIFRADISDIPEPESLTWSYSIPVSASSSSLITGIIAPDNGRHPQNALGDTGL